VFLSCSNWVSTSQSLECLFFWQSVMKNDD